MPIERAAPSTMEMADSIYGVTMEEFGISKILSLKFVNKSDNTQEIPEKSAEVEAENIEKIH